MSRERFKGLCLCQTHPYYHDSLDENPGAYRPCLGREELAKNLEKATAEWQGIINRRSLGKSASRTEAENVYARMTQARTKLEMHDEYQEELRANQ